MDIEKIKTQMCDNYCKHFAEIRATFEDIDRGQEELDRICEHCPLNELEEVEVVHGEWKECKIVQERLDEPIIDEWQSARCSVCGKHHTTPYMYYFDNFNYCPNCGADMRGGTDDTQT